MVPRSQMMSIRSTQTPKEFLPAIIEAAHSRYPVVGESLDDVMGVLLAKDLLPLILHNDERPFDIKELLRPATFVPESKRLNVLLREFRANRNHMAIVIDEYGGVAGLVTIEDVLEQIVGDIEDEHDVEEDSYIKPLPSGDFIVKALTPVDAFNDFFGSEFSDEEFDTVGGLVMSAFGHLPKRNEVVEPGRVPFPRTQRRQPPRPSAAPVSPAELSAPPPPRRRGHLPAPSFWRLASPSFTLAPCARLPCRRGRCRPAVEGGPGLRSRTLNRL